MTGSWEEQQAFWKTVIIQNELDNLEKWSNKIKMKSVRQA